MVAEGEHYSINILHLLSSHYFKTINILANDLHVKCVQYQLNKHHIGQFKDMSLYFRTSIIAIKMVINRI